MKPVSVSSSVRSDGRQLVAAQKRGDPRIQTRIADIFGTDVHREIQRACRRDASAPPAPWHDPSVQRVNRRMKPVCSAKGMKSAGHQQSACRMLPTQQHLGARDATGAQFDLRLEVQAQFVVLDGMAQLTQQRELIASGGLESLLVDRQSALLARARNPRPNPRSASARRRIEPSAGQRPNPVSH